MWNTLGTELAVVDNLGRVSLYAVYMSVNMLQCTRNYITDQEDDLSALVGFWWLNTDKAVSFAFLILLGDKIFSANLEVIVCRI